MDTVVIVVHLMVIVALIAVVLVQRSEGGALGIGGSNNFLTGRGSGNVFTKATGILGAAFFATSLAMTILARLAAPPSAILDTVPTAIAPAPPAATDTVLPDTTTGTGSGGILDQLESFTGQSDGESGTEGSTTTVPPAAPAEPQVPVSE